ncbi:MAG: hypothetical protein U1B80_09295, partial [Anaerolineaceae bacterium]|nr:hypothetical protein [Anaerolineaceae bacterium]
VWSPDGEWLAVGLQVAGRWLSKQLWLMRLDGSGQTAITDNPVHTHAAYRWDASGQAIAFQRLQLGSSLARPEVVIWQRRTGDLVVVAQDAGMPAWLP